MVTTTTRARSIPTWAVLAICCAAQFMVVLDIAIVNVALPQMRASLGLSVAGEQWVVNSYALTFAGFLMLGGRAGDLFGRRRIFIIGLTVFTACSLLGGLANTGTLLILARAAQGDRRRHLGSRDAQHSCHDVHRPARPSARSRRVVGDGRQRCRRWGAGRRRTHQFAQLAVGALRQRPDRHRAGRRQPGGRSRVPSNTDRERRLMSPAQSP